MKMMKGGANPVRRRVVAALIAALALVPLPAAAFNSGSTGADGALNPTVDTEITACSDPPPLTTPCLPDSGILNLTSLNVPAGVTLTFKRNTLNTPVVLLVAGDVTIVGTVDLSGKSAAAVGAAGDGSLGDEGLPGVGGPGGFDGGQGGHPDQAGGAGLGPGGGSAGVPSCGQPSWSYRNGTGGGGGGFGAQGASAYTYWSCGAAASGGGTYGSSLLLPLIGGSGGGGGAGGTAFRASGGGGGGGAILLAASGTVSIAGTLRANGGNGGNSTGGGCGASGGGGGGGGIRIVATVLTGSGAIQAKAGSGGDASGDCGYGDGGAGGDGRIRIEAATIQRTAATTPAFTTGSPGQLSIAGSPALLIASVAGVAAPATPTGSADIVLPAGTPNPVTVVFTTRGVLVANTVTLTVTPATGATTSVVSPALNGTVDSATASVSVNLPSGPSVLSAMTTYTVTAAVGNALSRFASGERVDTVTLVARPGSPSMAVLRTVSGKTYEIAAALLPAGS